MDEKILKQTEKYYSEKIKEYGTVSKGVDWKSEESQFLRFDQLSKVFEQEGMGTSFTVCDYGCGYGAFVKYLREKGYVADYTGVDVSKEMIEAASATYGTYDNVSFIIGNNMERDYDYIIASGIFNVKQGVPDDVWNNYMLEVINQINEHAQKGFAINCLTKYSDREFMRDDLYYSDPLFYFDYAKTHFSKNVALLHDYDLYEYTLIVRK